MAESEDHPPRAMTDLAARLRDVLTEDFLIQLLLAAEDYERNMADRVPKDERMEEFRGDVLNTLMPAVSSLLEEREREIVAYLRAEDCESVAKQIENGWHRK